ncbi:MULTISPECIES: transcriptional regulator [Agrobacterium]|uniref:transcriptional regulator n=1 Tax=Agrobacterium TaxID=357 RepID=UPI0011EF52E1|nr:MULTISPECIES: transcriptional regulator [Agrobacterium]MCZ7866010.1 transcriptional regulator [Agrobacterium salinitolerans]MDA5639282.1 transcriptional regulator [Agrobacterium sp. ST15.13.013]MDA6999243.1 transcriptional regulator [Agrobacterium salinitolerans]QXC52757.1 transcriptional regulator [Agrobacterium salinitolerans]QXC53017.1 transcriptional regulator [Agrobacterium salinitolerans]
MASNLSERWQAQALSVFTVREILEKPIEGESAQSRIKQIGMMNILYLMHQAHQKLTLSKVIEITGMTRGGVVETIDLLVRRGILKETLGRNSMGRGTARQFEFSQQVFAALGGDVTIGNF